MYTYVYIYFLVQERRRVLLGEGQAAPWSSLGGTHSIRTSDGNEAGAEAEEESSKNAGKAGHQAGGFLCPVWYA